MLEFVICLSASVSYTVPFHPQIPPAKKAPAKEKKRKSTGGGTKKVAKIKKGPTASSEEPEVSIPSTFDL
jgi:hypothetical protein